MKPGIARLIAWAYDRGLEKGYAQGLKDTKPIAFEGIEKAAEEAFRAGVAAQRAIESAEDPFEDERANSWLN